MSPWAGQQFLKTGSIFLGVIWLDQLIKWLFWSEAVINTGVSFSLGHQLPTWLLTATLVGLTLWLAINLWPLVHKRSDYRIAYAIFFGGAVSNLFDRFLWGGVVDVWLVPFLGVRNNLADWMIVGSATYVLGTSLYNNYRGRKKV